MIASDLGPRFKRVEGRRTLCDIVETIWEKVLELIIALKSSDNGNDYTSSISKVDSSAAPEAPGVEDNGNINFLAHLSLVRTSINISNISTITENDAEEGL